MRFTRFFPYFFFVLGACGGQSCSCLQPIKGGFPIDGRRHEGAMQVRVTRGGLDYLQSHGKELVGALLPTGSTFNVPPSCGGKNEVCCGNPAPMCRIDIGVQKFALKPTPPSVLKFVVTSQIISKDWLPITYDTGFLGKAKCLVKIDTTASKTTFKDIDLASDLTFAVDATTKLTSITLEKTAIDHLDASMVELKSQPGDFLCTVVQWIGPIKTFVIDQLKKSLTDQVGSAAEDAFCAKCKTPDECDGWADGCKSGKCTRGGKCLQEIGAAGRLDVGAMLSTLSPSTRAGMDTLTVLGGYAELMPAMNSGLSLGMLGGGQGDPHAPCVPVRPAPIVAPVGKWAAATGEVEPALKKPYHVGIGIHESHLATMGWAAFDGGALCLAVGTAAVPALDAKTLAALIGSLNDLTHGNNSPVWLVMRPSEEPRITIGAGTMKDPLLRVRVPRFAIDIYAFLDERAVRILTLTADIELPVGLEVNAMGEIVPVLGDLAAAFKNVSVSNSQLLSETPEKLASLFGMFLGIAVGEAGKNIKPVKLPQVMGLNLKVVAIEPTDGNKFLALFANLELGASMGSSRAETEVEVDRVSLPRADAYLAPLDPSRAPSVGLVLGGDADDLEWSLSLDGGATWSPYSSDRRRTVSHPTWWLPKRHEILARARTINAPASADPTPSRLAIDTTPPVDPIAATPAAGCSLGGHTSASPLPFLALFLLVTAFRRRPPRRLSLRPAGEPARVGPPRLLPRRSTPEDHHGGTENTEIGNDPEDASRPSRPTWSVLGVFRASVVNQTVVPSRRLAALPLCALCASVVNLSGCSRDTDAPPQLGKGDFLDAVDQIGRHSDAVAKSGTLHLSAYDDSFGDLAYAQVDTKTLGQKPIAWQWVDGVPIDSPSTASDSPRRGILDPGDDVGLYSSIALAPDGTARIAYHDATNRRLKFARADGNRIFSAVVVDAPMKGIAGLYASLSVDASGVPSIAYATTEIPDGQGGFVSRLRLATAKTAEPRGPADWTIVDLDETYIPCAGTGKAGLCPDGQACVVLDPKDRTRKSTCKPVDAACPMGMACKSDEACVAGKCTAFLPPVKAPDLIEGTGLFARLLRTKSGRAVVYHDRIQGDLKAAVEIAPGMFSKLLVDGMSPSSDVGQHLAAMVAPDDTIHVAYVDALGDRLLYKTVRAAMPSAMPEVVDDGARMEGPRPVGAGASLWTDGGTVRVVYQEQQAADLWQATRASGTWGKTPVHADDAGHGFWPHLVPDGGKLWLTEFVYDRAAEAEGRNFGSLVISAMK